MTARTRLSVIGVRHFSPTMGDAVQVSLPASEVPRTPAGPAGGGAGQRMRAIDTLLADRGQLFQALFLSAPIPKALVDLDGHILVANPMLCALTGRTAEELAGRHVDLLRPPRRPAGRRPRPRARRRASRLARRAPAARRRAPAAPLRRHRAVGRPVARDRPAQQRRRRSSSSSRWSTSPTAGAPRRTWSAGRSPTRSPGCPTAAR